MKFDTKVVQAGITPDPTTGAILPPLYQTATYVLEEVGKDKGFDYTRSSNPTRQVMEEILAILDGGKFGIAFASGMSAVDSCMRLLKAGDHVICSDDVYGGVSRHFNQILVNYDLHFSYVDSSNSANIENAIQTNTKIGIFGESGSGKSTFINLICGFLKGQGDLIVDGLKISKILEIIKIAIFGNFQPGNLKSEKN